MKNHKLTAFCLIFSLLTGCSHVSEEALRPVLGLQWYTSPEDVRIQLNNLHFLEERHVTGSSGEWQLLLDYDTTDFYDAECTLTLCFTSLGLVGLNYHDVMHERTYQEWSLALEGVYGIPTEESKGLSAWYQNPLGKNTSIYLFNLEEGVQISFYAEYSGSEKAAVSDDTEEEPETIMNIAPMPETRTPVIPMETIPPQSEINTTQEIQTTAVTEISELPLMTTVSDLSEISSETITVTEIISPDENQSSPEQATDPPEELPSMTNNITSVQNSETSSTSVTTTTTVIQTTALPTEPPTDPPPYDPLNGLNFYMSPDSGRRQMSDYSQLYEYRTEEPGQPWELIMEYDQADFYHKPVQAVLCFTSLGLVGVNYFDENPDNYSYWVAKLLPKIYKNL